MNIKIIIGIGLILSLLVVSLLIVDSPIDTKNKNSLDNQNNVYSGPVPLNHDEDYFRQTGITKKLENNG